MRDPYVKYGRAAGVALPVLLLTAGLVALAQNAPPPAPAPPFPPAADANLPPAQPPSPQQFDDLVAPIALYPDPLLGEVLAASTYPLEIVEAEQWVQDHPKWKPSKLMNEAKKQHWDPSVQGLVAFPQVLAQLNQDVNWTTSLGNAFLANQSGVMQAVQRMRSQAYARGTLRSTPQETVTTQNQNGQTAIDIQPANPDIWDVPNYNPVYVWGPPPFGYYPPLLYPGVGIGIGWFPGIDLGLYFGGWGGWGWGGWGWMPNWYGGQLIVNNSFFHRFGFRDFHGANALGSSAWAHNPAHRLGVPYANSAVASRYRGGEGGFGARAGFREAPSVQGQRFGSPAFEQRSYTNNHSVFGGYHDGGMTRMQSDHGFSSMGGGRSFGGGFHGGGGRR